MADLNKTIDVKFQNQGLDTLLQGFDQLKQKNQDLVTATGNYAKGVKFVFA